MIKFPGSIVESMVSTEAYNVKAQSTLDAINDAKFEEGLGLDPARKPLVRSLFKNQKKICDSLTAIYREHDCRISMTPVMGAESEGLPFNSLNLLGLDCALISIRLEIADGTVAALWLFYDDGSMFSRGKIRGGETFELSSLNADEKIIAAKIKTGKETQESHRSKEIRIMSVALYTNRGRSLVCEAAEYFRLGEGTHQIDNVEYTEVTTRCFDIPLHGQSLKGLWGRSDDSGILGLGFVWGAKEQTKDTTTDLSKSGFTSAIPKEMTLSKEDFKTLATEYEGLERRFIRAQLDLETANAKLSLANSEKNKLERAALILPKSSAWKTDRVQIYCIFYGSEPVTNDDVARTLISYAENGLRFGWGDVLWHCNPSPGFHESGAVFYRYNNSGEVKCLMWRQSAHGASPTAKFDPL